MRDTRDAGGPASLHAPTEVLELHEEGIPARPQLAEEAGLRWTIPLTLAACALLLFAIGSFASSYRATLTALPGDVWRWILDPQIGGGSRLPTGLVVAIPVSAAIAVEGWLAARLILAGSRAEGERWLEAGLAIVLAISILGFGGVVCVALGRLAPLELLALYGAIGAMLTWASWRRPRAADRGERVAEPPTRSSRVLVAVTAIVASIVIVFSLAHATMGPVTEWDATVYHAESARLWFLERPDPPLRYGPSIGIEISANYPPLFPAAGAALYTLVGAPDDVYLRVLSPLLLAGILLMLFGFARRRSGSTAASLAVLLVAASPLALGYAVWTTGYALLAALVLAVVILVDLAVERDDPAPWAPAGAVAGLAILSQFYGLLTLLAPLSALASRRPRRWRGALVFGAAAAVVAAPWLLRNVILLGDPFYPLGSPPFSGKGLVEPIWTASKIGISSKALTAWIGATGPDLTLRQLATSLFGPQLLATSCYFGLWFGLVAWRRAPRAAYLAAFVAGFIVVLLLQGWYWLRALIPIVPVAALLTALMLSSLLASRGRLRSVGSTLPSRIVARLAHAAIAAVIVLTVALTATLGTSLAVGGPSSASLGSADDLMRDVRIWGSPREQLWGAFGGDLLMWEWLNLHLGPEDRFATLEIRTYYLDRPQAAFYLDGIEAVPLLDLSDPEAIERYLAERGVRFVVLPSWAIHDPSAVNISGLLPLFRHLGSDRFPALAAFPVGRSESPSVVYSVGAIDWEPRIGLATSTHPAPPTLAQTSAVFPARDDGSRFFVPAPRTAPAALRFEYRAGQRVGFELTLLAQAETLPLRYADAPASDPGWRTAIVPLPPSPLGILDIAVFPYRTDLAIRGAQLIRRSEPIVLAPERRLPDGGTGYHLESRESGRVFVPVGSRTEILRFEYLLAQEEGRLEVLVRRAGGSLEAANWTRRSREDGWVTATVRVGALEPGFVEVSLRSLGSPLRVRAIDIG